MKIFYWLVFILFLTACTNTEESLPQCIEDILEDQNLSTDIKTVKLQEVNGEKHYWLNTDHMYFDGVEFIVNEICDTVCGLCGECFPPDCYYDYDMSKWEIIWSK